MESKDETPSKEKTSSLFSIKNEDYFDIPEKDKVRCANSNVVNSGW